MTVMIAITIATIGRLMKNSEIMVQFASGPDGIRDRHGERLRVDYIPGLIC